MEAAAFWPEVAIFEEGGGDFEVGLNGRVELLAAMPAKSLHADAKNNDNLRLRDAEAAHASDFGAVLDRGMKGRTADDFEGARFGDAGVDRRVHMSAG